MDGNAVIIHQDALDIVRAAGGRAVEHIGDVGGDRGKVVKVLEAADLFHFIGEHPVEEQVAVWNPMVQMGITVQPSLKYSSVTKFSVTLVMAEITRSEPPMTSS